jgi:hypothetical protein
LERPGVAQHVPSQVSKGLLWFLKCQSKDEATKTKAFDLLYPMSRVFENTNMTLLGEEFNEENVFVTEEFVKTVKQPLLQVSVLCYN